VRVRLPQKTLLDTNLPRPEDSERNLEHEIRDRGPERVADEERDPAGVDRVADDGEWARRREPGGNRLRERRQRAPEPPGRPDRERTARNGEHRPDRGEDALNGVGPVRRHESRQDHRRDEDELRDDPAEPTTACAPWILNRAR